MTIKHTPGKWAWEVSDEGYRIQAVATHGEPGFAIAKAKEAK